MIELSLHPTDTGLQDLIAGLEMVSTKYLPNTVRAIKVSTAILEYTWKSYAMGAPIPGTNIRLHSVRGAYARSIKKKVGQLSGMVYSDSPYAAEIEEGTEAKDLKKILPWGQKARMGKNGPYTIVPFRHGVPGGLSAPMPEQVYRQLLRKIEQGVFKKSSVRRQKVEGRNVFMEKVQRRMYKWGSRAKVPDFPNLEGMVVFNVPSGGRESRGEYVTFRVCSANPPKVSKAQKGWEGSWVVPSRRGYHLTRYVVANTSDILAQVIRAGITMDLTP